MRLLARSTQSKKITYSLRNECSRSLAAVVRCSGFAAKHVRINFCAFSESSEGISGCILQKPTLNMAASGDPEEKHIKYNNQLIAVQEPIEYSCLQFFFTKYLDGANSIKTGLHVCKLCKLQTDQGSYMSLIN